MSYQTDVSNEKIAQMLDDVGAWSNPLSAVNPAMALETARLTLLRHGVGYVCIVHPGPEYHVRMFTDDNGEIRFITDDWVIDAEFARALAFAIVVTLSRVTERV